jgi:hypothetical protein
LRDYLWAGRQLTAFDQVLFALTYSVGALLLLELITGAIGVAPGVDWRLGSFLTNSLLSPRFVDRFTADLSLWYRFLTFAGCAIALPSALRWLRTRSLVLKLKAFRHLSLHRDGFEALLEETRFEAGRWDDRWAYGPNESPWLMIDVDDGHRYMGQMMWRSTAPDPLELILIDVKDVTDPATPAEIPGLLLLSGEDITRVWVMRPDNSPNDMSPSASAEAHA